MRLLPAAALLLLLLAACGQTGDLTLPDPPPAQTPPADQDAKKKN